MAQSSSHQIGKLEDAIDVVIFERQQNGLKLTCRSHHSGLCGECAARLGASRGDGTSSATKRNSSVAARFLILCECETFGDFLGAYEGMFAGCSIQLLSGDPLFSLQRLDAGQLDCALLPMPIDASRYFVHQIAQAPLVVCMRSDDHLSCEPSAIECP